MRSGTGREGIGENVKKIAIMFNEKYRTVGFEAYHYSVWFRIFGATSFGYITGSCSSEKELIEDVRRKLYGNLKFIRIVEVSP